MQRRNFLKTTAATGSLAAVDGARAQDGKTPNLLIVHCDEHNFRTLGCYRDTLVPDQAYMWGTESLVETPHIDSLARDGVLCTKTYAATPVCSPSRSSFLSGQYPQHTPVTNNNVPLDDSVITFAEILGKAGYATGYAGKWHLDGDGKPQWAPKRKFGFADNRYMFNRGHWKQFEDTPDGPAVKAKDKKGQPSYSVEGADEESFATDFLTQRCINFMEEHKATPFCYMLSIPDPHGPDTVRAPYDNMFSDAEVRKPRTFDKDKTKAPSWAMPAPRCNYKMAQYRGMVKCIDDCVGKLIAWLRSNDLYDNTIVVFTADHGDMRGEHHRQNKGIPLEASAKIPFVVRYPKQIPGGTRVDHVINTVDFLPTMLAMMGVETAGKEEGRDVSKLLATGKAPKDWKDVTFFRSTGAPGSDKGWVGAVTPRYKLLLSDKDEPWLLDLEQDPDELTNYIGSPDHQEVVKALAQELATYGETHEDPYLKNASTAASLKALAG